MEKSNFLFLESFLVDSFKYGKQAEIAYIKNEFETCAVNMRLFLETALEYFKMTDNTKYSKGQILEGIKMLEKDGIIRYDVVQWLQYLRLFGLKGVHYKVGEITQAEALLALESAFKLGRFLYNRGRLKDENKFLEDFNRDILAIRNEDAVLKKSSKKHNTEKTLRQLNSVGKEVFVRYFHLFRKCALCEISNAEAIALLVQYNISNLAGATIRVGNANKIFDEKTEDKALDLVLKSSRLPHEVIEGARRLRKMYN